VKNTKKIDCGILLTGKISLRDSSNKFKWGKGEKFKILKTGKFRNASKKKHLVEGWKSVFVCTDGQCLGIWSYICCTGPICENGNLRFDFRSGEQGRNYNK